MKTNVNSNSGQRLHQIRVHREKSQGQIAKAIGVSVGTIQNYEHGRAHITMGRIEQLARALQCEPADLLARPDSPLPRYRRPRYQYKQFACGLAAVLAMSSLDPTLGRSPQLTLDLKQLADKLNRIDPDDLA